MIRNLAEVKKSSSLTDKTHGTVTLGPKETLGSKDKIAYVYLKAEGNAVKHLTDPHITIWGKNARKDSWISSVEFSWAGARHVYFNLKSETFWAPHIPSSDTAIAQTPETLLAQFLNLSQIASLTLRQSASSPSSGTAGSTTASSPAIDKGSSTYNSDWPSPRESMGKRVNTLPSRRRRNVPGPHPFAR